MRTFNDHHGLFLVFTPQHSNHDFTKLVTDDVLTVRVKTVTCLPKHSGISKVAQHGIAFVLIAFKWFHMTALEDIELT